jgi:hypothetical protein
VVSESYTNDCEEVNHVAFQKTEPKQDKRYTGKTQWKVIKDTKTHRLERLQKEVVNFDTGEVYWADVRKFTLYDHDDRYEERVVEVD